VNHTFEEQPHANIRTVGKNQHLRCWLPPLEVAMCYIDAQRPYQNVNEDDVPILKAALRKLAVRLAEIDRSPKPMSA
jgi:hypothetical protein